jgi:Protein of unknown function (DUF3892)
MKDKFKTSMATRLQVTCVNKTDRYNPYERIENIGGVSWKHLEEDAIAYIENNVYSYYVNRGGYQTNLIVAVVPCSNETAVRCRFSSASDWRCLARGDNAASTETVA